MSFKTILNAGLLLLYTEHTFDNSYNHEIAAFEKRIFNLVFFAMKKLFPVYTGFSRLIQFSENIFPGFFIFKYFHFVSHLIHHVFHVFHGHLHALFDHGIKFGMHQFDIVKLA